MFYKTFPGYTRQPVYDFLCGIFLHIIYIHQTAEQEYLISLSLSLLSQGSDADKSDDNLVVDEVSRRPPASIGLTSPLSSAYIM